MDSREFNKAVANLTNKACRGCIVCNGYGCRGEIPGMGAMNQSLTFINNFKSWNNIEVNIDNVDLPLIGVAPMTGVGQNMGNVFPEAVFHDYMVKSAKKAGVLPCIGDGTPDYKLQSGVKALKNNNAIGTAFIKPYPNRVILERFKIVEPYVDTLGLDIDSYRIPTMEGLVALEKKNAEQLLELKEHCIKKFIIKGIQSQEDLELMEIVKPDIIVVSNHGGRVFDNGEGIAYRLQKLIPKLKNITSEIWVDGGLRTIAHLKKAKALGATRVLIGRPLVKAVSVFKEDGVSYWLNQLK